MTTIRQQLVESLCTNDNKQKTHACKKPNAPSSMAEYNGCPSREESPISVISHSATAVSQPSSACTSMEHHKSHLYMQVGNQGNRHYPIHREQGSMASIQHSAAASISEDDSSANCTLPTGFFEVDSSKQELHKGPGPSKRMKSTTDEEATKQNYPRGLGLKSEASQAPHFSSRGDEDHPISFGVQGLEETLCGVLQENLFKANGMSLGSDREKQTTAAKLEDRKRVQNLIRSTSNGAVMAPVQRKSDTIGGNFNVEKSWDLLSTGALVDKAYSQPSPKSPNQANMEKSLIRTKSINPTTSMASSKWDDAEKWLCLDKDRIQRSHNTKVRNPGVPYTQSGPRRNHVAPNLVLPNSVKSAPSKGSPINHARRAEGGKMESCAPCTQQARLNAMPLEENWPKDNGRMSVQRTIRQFQYLSSGEIRGGSQHSLSPASPKISGHHQLQHFGYLSSGEILHQSHFPYNAPPSSTSDGETHLYYASAQPYNGNTKYSLRLNQHQILQKLRNHCAANNDGLPKSGNYCVGDIVDGGRSHDLSRLSVLAGPHKLDWLRRQGSSGIVLMDGKADEEMKADDVVGPMTVVEFSVQKPMHERSASMKDACTEVSPSISRRDIGTEMTPLASAPTSKCMSPAQNTSPIRHNTPTRTSNHDAIKSFVSKQDENTHSSAHKHNLNLVELESCHMAKLELRDLPSGSQTSIDNSDIGSVYDWSPIMCSELEMNGMSGALNSHVNGVHSEGITDGVTGLEATSWEEVERAKCSAKYKREEARINAWENLQKAKAEAELKKLEVRLEKLRSRVMEKVMGKVAAAERRAEEMRATAEMQQAKQMRKVRERACSLRKHAHFPGSFAVCFAHNYMA